MISTKIKKIDPLSPQAKILQEAAVVIRNGGLVIIPTETVYGVAANALNQETIKRLSAIKKRPPDKPFSLLADKKEKIEECARNIPVAAYKLTDKFWPGPLTIILKSAQTGTIGIRMPDHPVALRLIELAGVPIVCPSANLPGRAAAGNFSQAIADLNGQVELAIDAGDTPIGVESTVVDLSVEPIKIIREGAIQAKAIEETVSGRIVLFVCTGNSCRSVMAQALLEKKLQEKHRQNVEVLSAGLMRVGGLGATQLTKEVLAKEGIDVSAHRSQQVTSTMIKKSDFILVMEKIHEEKILQLAPEVKNRVFLLKEFAKISDQGLNIEDPIGRPLDFYEKTFAVIKQAIERMADLV